MKTCSETISGILESKEGGNSFLFASPFSLVVEHLLRKMFNLLFRANLWSFFIAKGRGFNPLSGHYFCYRIDELRKICYK